MKKYAVFVFFVVATLLVVQMYSLSITTEDIQKAGGFLASIKQEIRVFWIFYIPTIVFIILETIKTIIKNEKSLQILEKTKNIFFILFVWIFVLYEIFIFLFLYSIDVLFSSGI